MKIVNEKESTKSILRILGYKSTFTKHENVTKADEYLRDSISWGEKFKNSHISVIKGFLIYKYE